MTRQELIAELHAEVEAIRIRKKEIQQRLDAKNAELEVIHEESRAASQRFSDVHQAIQALERITPKLEAPL